jgi:hypothetical protein
MLLSTLAQLVVIVVGLYFLALAAVALAWPAKASGFLGGFAASAPAHYLELALRLVAGWAFVQRADLMSFTAVFAGFGWVLIGSTLVLLALPWRWHRRFAERTVPQALRHLKLVALASLLLGLFVLICAASRHS